MGSFPELTWHTEIMQFQQRCRTTSLVITTQQDPRKTLQSILELLLMKCFMESHFFSGLIVMLNIFLF